jgi:hypothetical protein
VGRTPLHYAAALDDDEYMYTMLRDANARDDEEDLVNTNYYCPVTQYVNKNVKMLD